MAVSSHGKDPGCILPLLASHHMKELSCFGDQQLWDLQGILKRFPSYKPEWERKNTTLGVVLNFHCCDKVLRKVNPKEKSFILAHGFWGFNPWLAGSVVIGLSKVEHHGQRTQWSRTVQFMAATKQTEGEWAREEGSSDQFNPQGQTSITYSPQLGRPHLINSHHVPIIPSDCDPMN